MPSWSELGEQQCSAAGLLLFFDPPLLPDLFSSLSLSPCVLLSRCSQGVDFVRNSLRNVSNGAAPLANITFVVDNPVLNWTLGGGRAGGSVLSSFFSVGRAATMSLWFLQARFSLSSLSTGRSPGAVLLHSGAAHVRDTKLLLAHNTWSENAVTCSCGGAHHVNFSLPGDLRDLGQSAVANGVGVSSLLSLLFFLDLTCRGTGGSWCGGGALHASGQVMGKSATVRWSNNTWVGNVVREVGNGGSVEHAAAVDMVNGGSFNGGCVLFFYFRLPCLTDFSVCVQAVRCGLDWCAKD